MQFRRGLPWGGKPQRAIDAARASAQAELDRVGAELQHTGPSAADVDEVLTLAAQVRGVLDAGLSEATNARVIELLDARGSVVYCDGTPFLEIQCRLTLDEGRLPIVSTRCS